MIEINDCIFIFNISVQFYFFSEKQSLVYQMILFYSYALHSIVLILL